MVSTTTNGYGAVTNRYEYWTCDCTLTDAAKASRTRITSKYTEEASRLKAIAVKEYWEQHPDEMKKLNAEKEALKKQAGIYTSQRDALGIFKVKEKKALQEKIDAINQQIDKITKELTKDR